MPIRKKIFQLLRTVSGRTPSTETGEHTSNVEPPKAINPEPPRSINPEPSQPVAPIEQPPILSASNSEIVTGLVLYGRPSCPYCARVDRVIEELDIEDKITRRSTTHGTKWRADLKDRTGSTQVPCLFIDGEVMFESADIIDWIRSNFD